MSSPERAQEVKSHRWEGEFEGDIILTRHKNYVGVNIPQRIVHHSPTGFEWGYLGSGPADLALNILAMYTDHGTAYRLHQQFKLEFIATMPFEGGGIKGGEIRGWIDRQVRGLFAGVEMREAA